MSHMARRRTTSRLSAAVALGLFGTASSVGATGAAAAPASPANGQFELPEGYQIEQVVGGLQLPSSITWDDEGRMYVGEAGSGLFPEQLAPIRILEVANGQATPVIELDEAVEPALVGLKWHDGAFYFTHRAEDLTGAVSRATPDGEVELLFDGILDSQAEHQINDIDVGPDGRMYVSVGPAGNAGVMGPSVAPWVMRSPGVHTTPCEDIVLTGHNYQTPNFLTEDPDDMVLTGAYVPFGTPTEPGQVIEGVEKCGGSILTFDPDNAEETIETHAWGFRNLLGLTWTDDGEMFVAENGYDIRGSRPVQGEIDATLRVEPGRWYGVPEYSASREPLTEPQFEPPDQFQVPVFLGTDEELGKILGSVIDVEASGLTPPDPEWVLGRHAFNSSPSMIDIAPEGFGEFAGQMMVAEWGDLAPPTNPLREGNIGRQVVAVDTETGEITPFVKGDPIARPFDVQFGPDGAMYIVDYGIVNIDMELKPPYAYQPGTGGIWKVTRMPVGGVDAGAGSTAGVESMGLFLLGSTALAGAAVAGAMVVRRRRRRAEDG
ncbi:PQQ-dependent sugar dehydrogenase [Blastococcus saxobsidens]|uniref:PQQ-dependent sugar dehydrogenase n=1 Tax=Blastococcus saxobsidens TaxID=138336 RepID=UPI0002D6BF7A|nr:sugar dehydrogenase [Blastococcus saxobsidens]